MAKFIIFALPRSRTKWLSEWLSFSGRYAVGHDLTVDCSSIADFEDALDAVDGTVETGAIIGWRLLLARRPDLRVLTVTRPTWEVIYSLQRLGLVGIDQTELMFRAEMLRALALQTGVENFSFDELRGEAACARLWEFALRRDFDYEWWLEMRDRNIQINMRERIARLSANAPGIASLKSEILAATLAQQGGAACGLN